MSSWDFELNRYPLLIGWMKFGCEKSVITFWKIQKWKQFQGKGIIKNGQGVILKNQILNFSDFWSQKLLKYTKSKATC